MKKINKNEENGKKEREGVSGNVSNRVLLHIKVREDEKENSILVGQKKENEERGKKENYENLII